jgi:N-acetylglucosamine kinase-like BadF-type ATPase
MSHLRKATQGCPTPDVVCGCFAGLLLPQQRELALEMLHQIFPSSQIYAEPDYAAALFASEPRADLAVIAGTGSIVCSFDGKKFDKSGGAGYLLGDVGSGFYFGRGAISKYVAQEIELPANLEAAVAEQFDTLVPAEIVAKLYSEPGAPRRLARLGDPVGKAAEDGADWAMEMVEQGMNALARVTVKHLQRHFSDAIDSTRTISVALSGGLWKGAKVFRSSFEEALDLYRDSQLSKAGKEVLFEIDVLHRPPVSGAVRLARTYFS